MSRRLLRVICAPRLIAVGLLILQLGLSTGGHVLHAWMHALQDGTEACSSCVQHGSTDGTPEFCKAGSGTSEGHRQSGLREQRHSSSCCASRETVVTHSPCSTCPQSITLPAITLPAITLPAITLADQHASSQAADCRVLRTPGGHLCWSGDCAFYRGTHQTSVVAEYPSALCFDQQLELWSIPADDLAVNWTHFCLRARGPPRG